MSLLKILAEQGVITGDVVTLMREKGTVKVKDFEAKWEEAAVRALGAVPEESTPFFAKVYTEHIGEAMKVEALSEEELKVLKRFVAEQYTAWVKKAPEIANTFLLYFDWLVLAAKHAKAISENAVLVEYPTTRNQLAIVPISPRFINYRIAYGTGATSYTPVATFEADSWILVFKQESGKIYKAHLLGDDNYKWAPPRIPGEKFVLVLLPIIVSEDPVQPYLISIEQENGPAIYPKDVSPAAQIAKKGDTESMWIIKLPMAIIVGPEWNKVRVTLRIIDENAAAAGLTEVKKKVKLVGAVIADAEFLKNVITARYV